MSPVTAVSKQYPSSSFSIVNLNFSNFIPAPTEEGSHFTFRLFGVESWSIKDAGGSGLEARVTVFSSEIVLRKLFDHLIVQKCCYLRVSKTQTVLMVTV